MCNEEFVKCPSGNISICAKKGTNAGQFCPKKTGGFKHNNSLRQNSSLRQNNPTEIAKNMSVICQSRIDPSSQAVNCALKLSNFENTKGGYPLFGRTTGIDDDIAQDKWCLNKDPELELNFSLQQFENDRGNC